MKNLNNNVLVLGEPDTGKTTQYVIPTILEAIHHRASVIVTDFNNSISDVLADLCDDEGYQIINLYPGKTTEYCLPSGWSKPTICFVHSGSDRDRGKERLSSMIIDLMLESLVNIRIDENTCDQSTQGLRIILDDFQHMSRLSSLIRFMRVSRMLDAGVSVIAQCESDIYDTYGKDGLAQIKANCADRIDCPMKRDIHGNKPMNDFEMRFISKFYDDCKMQHEAQLSDTMLLETFYRICAEIINRSEIDDVYDWVMDYYVDSEESNARAQKALDHALEELQNKVTEKDAYTRYSEAYYDTYEQYKDLSDTELLAECKKANNIHALDYAAFRCGVNVSWALLRDQPDSEKKQKFIADLCAMLEADSNQQAHQ